MAGRLGLFLMWLLHWLPLPAIAVTGRVLGRLLWWVNGGRRRVTRINLELCFPRSTPAWRDAIARRHFAAFAESALERALLWWAAPDRLRRLIRIEGQEYLDALAGQPVILLAPHFVGLDVGWTRLCLERDMVTMYARVKSPAFDAMLLRGRQRFGRQTLVSRQDGLRPVLAHLRAGRPFYYLPDMDYGPRDAVFAPFFGVPAATITALSRLARLGSATVLMVTTRREAAGYVVRIGPSWPDFPGADPALDALRMNSAIEEAINAGDPAEYFWSHKRFKTRPPGEKEVY
ncbi:MAG: lipid A biosynthesis acyltransferase [Proteobacteria bacterium]|nr:lipid A biosynthesis acyltransferase [Pseudomonadota bacterium]HQR04806.1 lipid A biosynthesis acyltransferase [Rhodocyclaceae bacterium]